MKNKTRYGGVGCPADDCSGGGENRQQILTSEQTKLLPTEVRAQIEGYSAKRCSYCGCVYIRDYDLSKAPIILGFLDNEILGKGWHGNKP